MRSEAEVRAVLGWAKTEQVGVVTRGSGTSPTGSARPLAGELVLDMAAMNRIVAIDPRDFAAVVEPGVPCGTLQAAVEAAGLFYPPDPASSRFSTLGGNVATSAGGLRAFKYGTTRDYVLGMRVVLMGGELLSLGGRSLKDVVGYDLMRLMVGSEGTLGVITELTLRLIPAPRARLTIVASFADDEGAFRGADAVTAKGVFPRALESMDRTTLEIVATAAGRAPEPGVGSRLLIELDGGEAEVATEARHCEEGLRAAGASEVLLAKTPEEQTRLWSERRAISSSVSKMAVAKSSEDIGVPRSALPEAVRRIRAAAARTPIRVLAYGHAGDANLHCNFLYDPRRPEEKRHLSELKREVFEIVLGLGGTISGEHGIGTKKIPYVTRALGPLAVRISQGVKRLFDPDELLNPGKLWPAEEVA